MASYDEPPTTQFLRHSDTQFNPIRRARCHKNLQANIPDLQLPTLEQEKNNPEHADNAYEACIRYLIGKTRNSAAYPLIYKENINYGFLRNLWGLKPFGVLISFVGLIVSAFYIRYEWINLVKFTTESVTVAILCLITLGIWIFWVSPKRVRVAAEAYAERLLEYCEQMDEGGQELKK